MNEKSELMINLYREMLRIRLFEERVLTEFSQGHLFGTTHTYIGQEADAVGILVAARRSDVVFSNHRGHGHYLAHGGDMYALAAEIMGKTTGVCGGKGGSQHLYWKGTFYSNGIQGGMVPCATGVAYADKYKQNDSIVIVFLGDGTLGEGVVYESLNIASLWDLPILYVVENNQYAQTTPVKQGVSGSISGRFESFGIETCEIDTTDVVEINKIAQTSIAYVRDNCRPYGVVIHTYRLYAHSKGDDMRDAEEIEAHWQFDPLKIHGGRIDLTIRKDLHQECQLEVNSAFERALSDSWPSKEMGTGCILG